MNKKQAILFIFSSMLSIATLILAETSEEKCLRKQIYANQVELTAKDKPVAIKIINNHVKKCKERLDHEQDFFKRLGTFLPAVSGVLTLVQVVMKPVSGNNICTANHTHVPTLDGCLFNLSNLRGTTWKQKIYFFVMRNSFRIESLKRDLKFRVIGLFSSITMCAGALLREYGRRSKIERLEKSLNRDIQVFERLKTVRNKNVT